MGKVNVVFLDLDGVMADFIGGVMREFALEYDYNNWPWPVGPDGWNWFEQFGVTPDEVDAICTAEFWANLEWMHDGRLIFESVRSYAGLTGVPISLLTTPMTNIYSTVGKLIWIRGHLGDEWRKTALVTQAPKAIFARKGALLIDDRDKNVEEWQEAGGVAILVPRPWNKRHAEAAVSDICVLRELESLCD